LTGGPEPIVVLTIAGSDSGAGAGLQADLKTAGALGLFATTAVTAVTAQNTRSVEAVHPVPTDVVVAQVRTVIDDFVVAAVKTGMLATTATVEAVADLATQGLLPHLVVDPVLVASTGRPLLDDGAVEAYRSLLLPRAEVTTPNLVEAALLAGMPVDEVGHPEGMTEAAQRIRDLGPTWVLVKGGHLPGVATPDGSSAPTVPDVLVGPTSVTVLEAPLVVTTNNHGTGCSTATAVACGLALGRDVPDAVRSAKAYVHRALAGAAGWQLGGGRGPLDHLGWTGAHLPAADHPPPDGAVAGS
jgi:hydroxymethylpyrimidine kinase/phosphomethylpyrimidine kinase